MSVLVIDIDHFKELNDEHGHEAGDTALATVGTLLTEFFRNSDIPCRYGGEEFVVVMPDAALHDAVHRAETLRELLANQLIQHRGATLGLTVSMGAACFPIHGSEPAEILRAADAALYAAKKDGRNRVSVAEKLSGKAAGAKTSRQDAA